MAAKPALQLPKTSREIPHFSLSQISVFTGMTRETVGRRLDKANAKPAARRGAHPVYDMRDIWRVLAVGSENADAVDPEKMEPHSKLAWFRAEQTKLELDAKAGRYITADDYASESARVFKLLALGLDTVVDVLERDCGLEPQALQVVENHIDRIRNQIADAVQNGDAQNLETPEDAEA